MEQDVRLDKLNLKTALSLKTLHLKGVHTDFKTQPANLPTPQFTTVHGSIKQVLDSPHSLIKKEQENEGIVEVFSVEIFLVLNTCFTLNNGTALTLVNSAVQFSDQLKEIQHSTEGR